jgi:DNA-binding IclR family transcriptional regulator
MKVDSFKNESSESGGLMTGRRSLALLEMIGQRRGGYSFSQLVTQTGLSAASLTRLLKMLVAEGWIYRAEHDGMYSIGARMLQLSDDLRVHNPSLDIIAPVVRDLSLSLGHSACVAAFNGDFFTLLTKTERMESYHFIDVYTPNADWIGNGMGRLLLSFQPLSVVEKIYRLHYKIAVPPEHIAMFEDIRAKRWLISEEGYVTRVIAAVQPNPAHPVEHLVSVAAMSSRQPDTASILEKVEAAARLMESRLKSRGVTIDLPA